MLAHIPSFPPTALQQALCWLAKTRSRVPCGRTVRLPDLPACSLPHIYSWILSFPLSKNVKVKTHTQNFNSACYFIWAWNLVSPVGTINTVRVCEQDAAKNVWIWKEVTGDWRQLHDEGLHNLWSSPHVFTVIKTWGMRYM